MFKLKDVLSSSCCDLEARLIRDKDRLRETIGALKGMGFKISMTQGVFDLLHIGHCRFLEEAKKLADILVVLVDSDMLTRSRKGEGRPIVPEDERLQMLAYIRVVDILVVRDEVIRGEGTAGDLIELIVPDFLITSETTKDFTEAEKKRLVEEGLCGKVVTLPAQATISTSARIRNLQMDGGRELSKKIEGVVAEYLKMGGDGK